MSKVREKETKATPWNNNECQKPELNYPWKCWKETEVAAQNHVLIVNC